MCSAVVRCAVVWCSVVWCSVVWCGVVICVVGSVGSPPENLMQAMINTRMRAMSDGLLDVRDAESVMQFVRDCGGFLLALGSEADIINGNVS